MSNNLISDLTQINLIKTNIKNAIETQGQNVTNFASYPGAIENIVTGGGVYQYDSLENMYTDISNRHNGDIGVVYYSNQSSVQPGDILNDVTFPKQVTFDIAITSSASLMIRGAGMYCQCRLSPTQFYIQDWSGTIPYIIYTSSDGLAYTRTDTYEDTYNFGGVTMPTNANTNICKFFIIGSINFDGLFQYDGTNFVSLSSTGLNATVESVWDYRFYGANGIYNGVLNKTTNLNIQQLRDRVNLYSKVSNLSLDSLLNSVQLRLNMTDVPDINMCDITSMSNTFYYSSCKNIGNINIASVRQANFAFYSLTASISRINGIYTRDLENTSNMFARCNNLTSIPNFDTNNVTNMYDMFEDCYKITSVPNFNTSKVIDMAGMFARCNNLTSIPNFNTNNVTNMYDMFFYCSNLSNIPNFDTNNVTNMYDMFYNCYSLIDVPELNMNKVVCSDNMFYNCYSLSDTSLSNIANSMPSAHQLLNILFANTGISANRLSYDDRNTLFNKGYLDCDTNTSTWSVQYNIYNGTWALKNRGDDFDRLGLNLKNIIKNTCNNVANVIIKSSSDGIDNGILLDGYRLFSSINITNSINLQINTSNLLNASSMFSECTNLRNISNFDTSNVTNIASIFDACSNLTSVPNLNTSKVTTMSSICRNCRKIASVPNFNTSNVTSFINAFYGCNNLISVPNFDTSKVIDMSGMFLYCYKLVSVSNFDTSKVIDMASMFGGCNNLVSIPNFNTSNVTNMTYMFYNCKKLISIPNLDTSKISNASQMYRSSGINKVSYFNVENVTNISYAFSNCNNLTDVCALNLYNTTSARFLFENCINLRNVGSIIFNSELYMDGLESIFYGCTNLINAPQMKFGVFYPTYDTYISMFGMFENCINLVNVPQYYITNKYSVLSMFAGCNNLSNKSIQNIINMCLNMNITNNMRMNLNNTNSYSPLCNTKFDSSYYSNRLAELDAAGWKY